MSIIKEELRRKLDGFIRKYYTSRLLKGLIYFIGLGIIYFLLVSFLEYFGRFTGEVRLLLLCALVAGLSAILFIYIIRPFLGLLSIGRRLSYEKAARLIGKHFPEVSDKITNTLELSRLSNSENRLIQASIDQRIEKLNPIPFSGAVDYRENVKYWPILVIPVLIMTGLLLGGQWSTISESSKRIMAYDEEFVPEAPFSFIILNDDFTIERGDNFTAQLTFKGNSIPDNAEFISESGSGRFVKKGGNTFEYRIDNLQNNTSFKVVANGFSSSFYNIEVIPVPVVRAFNIRVTPPSYTGVSSFVSEMKSVIDVPQGSIVEWTLATETTDRAYLRSGEEDYPFTSSDKGTFGFEKRILQNFDYKLVTSNSSITKVGEINNEINVIKDDFPTISADIEEDESTANRLYYRSVITDDYGFSRMRLIIAQGDKILTMKSLKLEGGLSQQLSGVVSVDTLATEEKELQVYLQVWDNDGVNGAKSARSRPYSIKVLSQKEQEKQLNKQYESYFSKKEEMEDLSQQINEELKALKSKLMNSKKAEWKDKERVRELLKKQDELLRKQQLMEKMREELQKKEDKLNPKNDELKKKEEELDALKKDADKQKELEKLMEEIDKLMEKLDMEKLMEKLDEMERASEQNQRSEERVDELLKKLKFEKDVLKEAEKMKELSEKMEELSKENNEDNKESEKQEEIKKEFEEAKKELEKLKKENENFKEETEKQKMEESQEGAEESMDKASEQLQKNEQQKANDSQQQSSEQMQEMSEKMMSSLMQMQSGKQQENMQTLRQILENLETLSFDVEELGALSKKSGKSDPLYRKLLTEQRRLQEGAKVIEDSLVALGKRVPQIQEVVYEELDKIKVNLDKSIQTLEEQQGAQSAAYQQFVMTSANNLALLLDEALRNMQQQMANMMKGSQSCQKPGGGKPSLSNMKKMQSELAKQMGQGKQGKKEGEGQGKNGKNGEKAEGRNGKEIVEMLSRQELIRRELENYMSENEGGNGDKGNLQKALKEMEEVEKDLLDGNITPESLERIKEIETRLLESEKAEREQEQDEKRESKTAEEMTDIYDQELEKYLREKENERENLYSEPLKMKKYYKTKSNEFLNEL